MPIEAALQRQRPTPFDPAQLLVSPGSIISGWKTTWLNPSVMQGTKHGKLDCNKANHWKKHLISSLPTPYLLPLATLRPSTAMEDPKWSCCRSVKIDPQVILLTQVRRRQVSFTGESGCTSAHDFFFPRRLQQISRIPAVQVKET